MNTSIQIPSSAVEAALRTAKGEVVKLVQGALLIAIAAIVFAGIASVAAPFCVWKGEVALFLNNSFHIACAVPAIAEYASAARLDWMSVLVAALIAAYPAYHAVWRVREGLGLSCEAAVFSKRVSRFLAAVSACLLLAMLFMGYGTAWLINGSAMGDQGLVETGHHAWTVSIVIMLGCALTCLIKWFFAKGPRTKFRQWFRCRAGPPRRRPAEAREPEPGAVLCGRAACLPAGAGLHCRGLYRRERGHRARIRSCGLSGVPCCDSRYPCCLVAQVAERSCEFLSPREKNLQKSQVLFTR